MKSLEILKDGRNKLSQCSEYPELESMILLKEISGISEGKILQNREMKKETYRRFQSLLKKRMSGHPVEYLVGNTNFLGLKIFINRDVLIPRPETEYMTEEIIEKLKIFNKPKILEIGTGSGAISLAVAHYIVDSKIIATDISLRALKLCRKNILNFGYENRIKLMCSDVLNAMRFSNKFDLVISNPPYITPDEILALPREVSVEPLIALNGGRGGVEVINRILKLSHQILKSGGLLYIELSESNIPYLKKNPELSIEILEDQFGRKRILRGQRK